MNASRRTIGLAVAAGVALIAVPTGIAWATTAGDDTDTPAQQRDQVRDRLYEDDDAPGAMMRGGTMRGGRSDGIDDDTVGRRGMMRGDGSLWIDDLVEEGATAASADADSLARMAEEERVARDLYVELGDAWDLRVFAMIATAEQRHMDAVGALLDAYGLDDPNDGATAGVYEDADLQALYDELLAQGSESETAALGVGALVEETDIADLRAQDVDSAAIETVYDRLEAASEHHLTAFVRNLDARGEEYVATVLDPDEVADITGVPAP